MFATKFKAHGNQYSVAIIPIFCGIQISFLSLMGFIVVYYSQAAHNNPLILSILGLKRTTGTTSTNLYVIYGDNGSNNESFFLETQESDGQQPQTDKCQLTQTNSNNDNKKDSDCDQEGR